MRAGYAACAACGAASAFRCSKCKCTTYCSRACQCDDWNAHAMKCGRVSDLSAGALTASRSRLHARRPSPLAVTGTRAFPREKNKSSVAASPDASERKDAKAPSRLAVTSVRRVDVFRESETTPPPPPREARLGTPPPPPPPPPRPAGRAVDDARHSSTPAARAMSGVAGHPRPPRDRPAPRRLATFVGDARRVPRMNTSPSATPPALPQIAGVSALAGSSRAPPRRPAPAAPIIGLAASPDASRREELPKLKTSSRAAETVRSLRRRAEQTLAAMARARISGLCASAASSVAVAVAVAPRVVGRPPPRRLLEPLDPTATATASSTSSRGPGDRTNATAKAAESLSRPQKRPKGNEAGGVRANAKPLKPEPDAAPRAASLPSPPKTPATSDASVTRLDDRSDRSRSESSSEALDAAPPERTPGDERETLRSRDETPATERKMPFSTPLAFATPPPPPRASDLPADALEVTFAFLPPHALAFAGATCRAWREVASRESLWARLLAKRGIGGGGTRLPCPTSPRGGDYASVETKTDVFSLESRWRTGKYARHDLHRHTWTVERVELVDTKTHGRVVVTGGWDGQVFAWRLKRSPNKNNSDGVGAWEPFCAFVGPGGAWVSALDATPVLVAAGDTNGRVFVWDYDGHTAPRRAWHHGGSVTTVRFAPSSGVAETEKIFVASASTDGDAKVWCVATGVLIATLCGHADVCWHVRFIESLSNADGLLFAVTAGRDGLAKTWRVPANAADTDDDDENRESEPRCVSTLRAHDDAILALATWDPDPDIVEVVQAQNKSRTKENSLHCVPLLATCGADDVVNVWRLKEGVLLKTLRGHARGVLCATFVVWDNRLTLVTGSADTTVRVWDIFTGSCLGAIADHSAPVTEIKARADALATVAPGDGVMAYWRPVDEASEDASLSASSGASSGASPTSSSSSLPSGLTASMTLMDGAGSGFSACLAMDRKMLAVGTKTGAVQVLDFRTNAP